MTERGLPETPEEALDMALPPSYRATAGGSYSAAALSLGQRLLNFAHQVDALLVKVTPVIDTVAPSPVPAILQLLHESFELLPVPAVA